MSALLSRIEDAGLNASAPAQQRWLDGWLLRFSPGKAKRLRCINAVAPGRRPLDDKLSQAAAVYREAGLPLFVRITPFSAPDGLDALLQARGMVRVDDTAVMVRGRLVAAAAAPKPPAGLRLDAVGHAGFAQVVGQMRGSDLAQRQAHAQRLELSPVPYQGFVLRREDDGAALAAGQFALESGLAGLYDVFTAEAARGQGLGRWLCARLLARAAECGATVGYLQVDGDNLPARRVYAALGFTDAYRYHYRTPPHAG